MELSTSPWLLVWIALAAVLYASVGQGGGSGYLAAMGLFGVEPAVMKPAVRGFSCRRLARSTPGRITEW